jgi:hypothetical protein
MESTWKNKLNKQAIQKGNLKFSLLNKFQKKLTNGKDLFMSLKLIQQTKLILIIFKIVVMKMILEKQKQQVKSSLILLI